MKKYRVIVPSWSELSAEMQVETGCKHHAFIRLGGIPLYSHILRLYENIRNDVEFIFVLSPSAPEIHSGHTLGFDVRVSRIEESINIGDTVLSAVAELNSNQAVIVHMADTLLDPSTLGRLDAIYIQERTDLYRWTSISKSQSGSVHVLRDRDQSEPCSEQAVCVGVFCFSDGKYFSSQLKNAVENSSEKIDPFFLAVESYSKKHKIELVKPHYWHDCGHVDSFYESRLNFHNLRHFNSLLYDPVRGLVTKRSNNAEAFRHQVRWFKQVPDELASFLPRIFESSDGELPYITMELLSIPSLGELFVNGRLELGAWNDVASKIKYIQNLFKKYEFVSPITESIAHEIYIGKTQKRILQFIEQRPEVAEMWIQISDRRLSLRDVLASLHEYAVRCSLLKLETLTPIHGDMCFSNLLYDSRGRNIKLIDPRGEFGVPGIYGDSRYDKAKLLHSYSGFYDFIVSDQFTVQVDTFGMLSCNVEVDDYHFKVKKIFDSTLFDGEQERIQCDAIQALLFLSMLPLHSDKPNRQLAMLFTGLTYYASNFLRE